MTLTSEMLSDKVRSYVFTDGEFAALIEWCGERLELDDLDEYTCNAIISILDRVEKRARKEAGE